MDISSFTPKKQVKIQFWLNAIRECRSSGLTNQAWCEQNNLSLKNYYYRIAKIRKLAIEDIHEKNMQYHCLTQRRKQAVLLMRFSLKFQFLYQGCHLQLSLL